MEQLPRFVRALMIALALSATGPAWSAPASTTPPVAAASVVNINTADAATLAAILHGVGDAKAQAIIAYRQEHGPFKTPEQLSAVKGIGEALVEKNRDRIAVK